MERECTPLWKLSKREQKGDKLLKQRLTRETFLSKTGFRKHVRGKREIRLKLAANERGLKVRRQIRVCLIHEEKKIFSLILSDFFSNLFC